MSQALDEAAAYADFDYYAGDTADALASNPHGCSTLLPAILKIPPLCTAELARSRIAEAGAIESRVSFPIVGI